MSKNTLNYLDKNFDKYYDQIICKLKWIKEYKKDLEIYFKNIEFLIKCREEVDELTIFVVENRKKYIRDYYSTLEDFNELLIKLKDMSNKIYEDS